MKTSLLKLSEISTTSGTQIRASINHEAVDEYANAMTDGVKFPPVVVFHDGSEYILADGFHRVMAANRNGFKDIEAEVCKGTKSDALKYALGANSTHGIKRTNADKRRSVELALAEWPKLSDNKLAEICAVSQPFVTGMRAEHITVISSKAETRIGRDGKERKLPAKKSQPIQSIPEPTAPANDGGIKSLADRLAADGVTAPQATEPRVTEYYDRLEALVNDALENASDKQLVSMSVFAATIPKLIKTELAERKQRK